MSKHRGNLGGPGEDDDLRENGEEVYDEDGYRIVEDEPQEEKDSGDDEEF